MRFLLCKTTSFWGKSPKPFSVASIDENRAIYRRCYLNLKYQFVMHCDIPGMGLVFLWLREFTLSLKGDEPMTYLASGRAYANRRRSILGRVLVLALGYTCIIHIHMPLNMCNKLIIDTSLESIGVWANFFLGGLSHLCPKNNSTAPEKLLY